MPVFLKRFGPTAGPAQKRNRRRNPFWRFRRFFFAVGVLSMVAVGFALYSFNAQPLPEDTSFGQLAETTYVCTGEVAGVGECNEGNSSAQLSAEENREIVTLEEIPEHVIWTTLAAEDRRFYDHKGVDPKGLARAFYQNATSQKVQGGSTITQQYVKQAILDSRERSFTRKGKEAMKAVQLEKALSKDEILVRYLNTIYYGRGAYGVKAAYRTYFGKDLSEITVAEAALLAGLIRAPEVADPTRDPEEADRRVETVFVAMAAEEWATEPALEAARKENVVAQVLPREERQNLGEVNGGEFGSQYFLEAVRIEMEKLFPENSETYTGGLRVYTTLDLNHQQQAFETVIASQLEDNPEFRASVVTIDAQGRVVAMVAGTDFEANRFNLATNGLENGDGRQPGSVFKSIALAELIEQGKSAESLFSTPIGQNVLTIPNANNGGPWEVRGRRAPADASYINAVEGLERSSNFVYAQMVLEITPEKLVERAQQMGIRSGLDPINSVVLGSKEVAPIDMASVFSTFEREGVALRPALIERIENADGEVLCWYPVPGETDCTDRDGNYESKEPPVREGTQAIAPQTARNVNYAMEGVVRRGTGKAARVEERRVAGKTGTTQNNTDAWFVGFSCDVTTAVWVGNDDNTTLEENGKGVSGGGLPSEMWSDYMTKYLDGAPECGSDQWPVSDDFAGEILGQDLLKPRLPCIQNGGKRGGDEYNGTKWENCIEYDEDDPNDPNNPQNPDSPFYFGNPNSVTNRDNPNSPFNPDNPNFDDDDNNDSDDDDDDDDDPRGPRVTEPDRNRNRNENGNQPRVTEPE